MSNWFCNLFNSVFDIWSSFEDFVSTSNNLFSVLSRSSFSLDILFSFKSASSEILFYLSKSDSIVLIDFSSFSCKVFTLASSSTRLDMSKFNFYREAALSIFLSLKGESFLFSSSSKVLL